MTTMTVSRNNTVFDLMAIPRDIHSVMYKKARNMLVEERKEIKKNFCEQLYPQIQMNSYRQTRTEIEGHASTTTFDMVFQKMHISYQSRSLDRLLQVPRNGQCKLTIFIDDDFISNEGFYWPHTRSLVYVGEEALLGFANDEKINLNNPFSEY